MCLQACDTLPAFGPHLGHGSATGSTKKKDSRCITLGECVRNQRVEALLVVSGTVEIEGVFKEMDGLELAETHARQLPVTYGASNEQTVMFANTKAKVAEQRKRYY